MQPVDELSLTRNQSGIAHIGLLALAALVIGVTGFIGYNVYQNNSSHAATGQTASDSVLCDLPDSDQQIDCAYYDEYISSGEAPIPDDFLAPQ